MEEIPNYSAYDLCQHQGCQCRSCGHDQGGVCGMDGGDCESAQRKERCPVAGCAAWIPNATEIAEYTIADMIRDLREAFRVQYEVEVDVQVSIHGTRNPHLKREATEKLGTEIAMVLGDGFTSEHRECDGRGWYVVEQPYGPVRISLFYREEAQS